MMIPRTQIPTHITAGGDVDAANTVWKTKYKADENDIVKMNAALLEVQEKLKQVEALDA